MLKRIAGVLAGIIVCGVVIFAIEWIGNQLFPSTAEAAAAGDLSQVPTGALVAVLVGWFVGPLLGGMLAAHIAERGWAAWIVAAFVLLGVVLNASMMPHPTWMLVLGILLPIAAGWLASRTARPVPQAVA